jgi:hypothetical protein
MREIGWRIGKEKRMEIKKIVKRKVIREKEIQLWLRVEISLKGKRM